MTRPHSLIAFLLCAAALAAEGQPMPTFQIVKTKLTGCNSTQTFYNTPITDYAPGDFNGDKKLDLAFVCLLDSSYHTSIVVANGLGDGTFAPGVTAVNIPVHDKAFAADMNGDGRSDLIFLSGCDTVQSPCFLDSALANPTGGFFTPVSTSVVSHKIIAVADLNGDHVPDVVLYEYRSADNAFRIALGHKDGTFTLLNSPVFTSSSTLEGASVGDFNGDGLPDIFVWNDGVLLTGKGDGTFNAAIAVPSLSGSLGTVGDFNGDGHLDLAALAYINGSSRQSAVVAFGDGKGGFAAPVVINGVQYPVIGADLNGDGKDDIVITDPQYTPVLVSRGDGTFLTTSNLFADIFQDRPTFISAADLNGDGKTDIIAEAWDANSNADTIYAALNTTSSRLVTGVLNGASFQKGQTVAPGSLVSVFGGGFVAPNTSVPAATIPLPLSLAGVSATVNGIPAPLQYVGERQINLQIPWSIPPGGTATVVVSANGFTYPGFTFQMGPAAPGIFALTSGQAIAINQDGSLAGPDNSVPGIATHTAKAGDPLIILGTGLGSVSPSVADGAASPDALRSATTQPTVLVGGVQAQVLFAGLSPQFPGVNQLNVIVPPVPNPGVVSLQIDSGGVRSGGSATMAVRNQ